MDDFERENLQRQLADLKKQLEEHHKEVKRDIDERGGGIIIVGVVFFIICIYALMAKFLGWPMPW